MNDTGSVANLIRQTLGTLDGDSAPTPAIAPRADTHGTILLSGSWWVIDCNPFVLMRLKRWIGRVDKTAHGAVRVRRTADVDRDMQAFLDRFPLEISSADLRVMHGGAETHRGRERLVAQISAGLYQPRAFDLALPARDYQRLAADLWLRSPGLLLADDMGVGKTVSAIAGLSDPRTRPALIVTLTHLPLQWQREIRRFLPGVRVHVLRGTKPYDIAAATAREERAAGLPVGSGLPDVLITAYSRIGGWADVAAPLIRSVIYDEVQELRHADTARYRAAAHLSKAATYRLGLSATPIHNYGGEFYSVVDALRPGELGAADEFEREWCTHDPEKRKMKIRDPRAFGLYLRESGIMLRRTRGDVGRELPGLTTIPHHIDADATELERMGRGAAELARVILAQRTGPGAGLAKMQAAGEFDRIMRQATGIAKAPYVAEFVRMLVESGERPVVFAWHREVHAILAERLIGYKPAFYTGEETGPQKQEALRRFTAGETPVLVMSLRAGAGVDGLQHASRTVVIAELDWSPVVHDQCIGRVNRDGQPDPVAAYFLIADTGSDPVVADVCGAKRSQSATIRDPSAALVAPSQADPDHVRRLAAAWLEQHRDRG